MNKIDVSIVVPLYNKENEIRRCLNSLIEQFVSNIEIIVVDDGSKDGSAEKYVQAYDECFRRNRCGNSCLSGKKFV